MTQTQGVLRGSRVLPFEWNCSTSSLMFIYCLQLGNQGSCVSIFQSHVPACQSLHRSFGSLVVRIFECLGTSCSRSTSPTADHKHQHLLRTENFVAGTRIRLTASLQPSFERGVFPCKQTSFRCLNREREARRPLSTEDHHGVYESRKALRQQAGTWKAYDLYAVHCRAVEGAAGR